MENRKSHAILAAMIGVALVAVATLPARADFETGMNYFKSGKYVEAAAEFQALVDSSPEYDYGYYILGQCFLQLDKPNDALKNFQKAIELNPDQFVYHLGLANAYNKTGNYRKVVETLAAVESIVPNEMTYHFYSTRGFAYAAMKKWSEAINDLENARTQKSSPTLLTQLGKAYFALNHHDKAAKAFQDSLRIAPNDTENYQLLAESLMNLGGAERDANRKKNLYTDALTAAERYASKRPGDFDAHNLVGRAALGAGNYPKAVSEFDEALNLQSDYCFAMVNKSKCYIAMEQWAKAQKELEQAAKCNPKMQVVYDSLGFVLRKQEKLEDSLVAYQKAYSINATPAVQRAIDEVKHNIEVRDHNMAAAAEEERLRLEAEKARKEAEEQQKKVEEYKRKTEDG